MLVHDDTIVDDPLQKFKLLGKGLLLSIIYLLLHTKLNFDWVLAYHKLKLLIYTLQFLVHTFAHYFDPKNAIFICLKSLQFCNMDFLELLLLPTLTQ